MTHCNITGCPCKTYRPEWHSWRDKVQPAPINPESSTLFKPPERVKKWAGTWKLPVLDPEFTFDINTTLFKDRTDEIAAKLDAANARVDEVGKQTREHLTRNIASTTGDAIDRAIRNGWPANRTVGTRLYGPPSTHDTPASFDDGQGLTPTSFGGAISGRRSGKTFMMDEAAKMRIALGDLDLSAPAVYYTNSTLATPDNIYPEKKDSMNTSVTYIRTMAGYVGQVVVNAEIVWESTPRKSHTKALRAANRRIAKVAREAYRS